MANTRPFCIPHLTFETAAVDVVIVVLPPAVIVVPLTVIAKATHDQGVLAPVPNIAKICVALYATSDW